MGRHLLRDRGARGGESVSKALPIQIVIGFGIAAVALYGPDPFWSPVLDGSIGMMLSMLVQKVYG